MARRRAFTFGALAIVASACATAGCGGDLNPAVFAALGAVDKDDRPPSLLDLGGGDPSQSYAASFVVEPTSVPEGVTMVPAVQVSVRDSRGRAAPDRTVVELQLEAPWADPAKPTYRAQTYWTAETRAGVATFEKMTLVMGGRGLRLMAKLANQLPTPSFGFAPVFSARFDVLEVRLTNLASDRPSAAVGEGVTLTWTTAGPPKTVTLLPGAKDVTSGSGAVVVPFADASTDRVVYEVLATTPGASLRRMSEGLTRVGQEDVADRAHAVAATTDRGCVIAGEFAGTATFGPGHAVTSAGDTDVFVARLRADGTPAWIRRAGGSGRDAALGLALLADGGVVVTGQAGPGAVFGGSVLDVGAFVARYSADGALAWARSIPSTPSARGQSIHAWPDGASAVAGTIESFATFGPGEPGVTSITPQRKDAFVARFRPDGALQWVRPISGVGLDGARDVAGWTDGRCVVVGTFGVLAQVGTGKLVLGAGEVNQTTLADYGMFVAAYEPSGALAWARGGLNVPAQPTPNVPVDLDSLSVVVTRAGEVVVAGSFLDVVRFEGTIFTTSEPRVTLARDAFLVRYARAGDLVGATKWGVDRMSEFVASVEALPDGSTVTLWGGLRTIRHARDGTALWELPVPLAEVPFTPRPGPGVGGTGLALLPDGGAWIAGVVGPENPLQPSRPGDGDVLLVRLEPLNWGQLTVERR